MIHDHAYEVRGESMTTMLTLYEACKLLSTWYGRDGSTRYVVTRKDGSRWRLVAYFDIDRKTVRPSYEATDQEKEDILENSSFFEVNR